MGMTIVERIGVSAIVSVGNKADIDDADLLQYLVNDPYTKVILIYLEGVEDGRKFMKAAMEVTPKKPIIVIKAGRTEAGAKAAASHTGALAGSVAIYNTLFKQTGILAAKAVEEAFDWARALSYVPEYKGGSVVIVTNGGGAGVQATDTLAEQGIFLSPPPKSLVETLKPMLPHFASFANPIDVTGMIDNERYVKAVMEALKNPEVGAVLALYCQTAVTDPMVIASKIVNEVRAMGGLPKPLVVSMIGGEEVYWAINKLNTNGIPAYPMPERGALALAMIVNYAKIREDVKKRLESLSTSS